MKDIRLEDLIEKLKEKHPNLSEKKIKQIVIRGCFMMGVQIKQRKDIQFKTIKNGISMTVYKPHSNKPKP